MATTLEELVVKLSADVSGFNAAIQNATKTAKDSTDKMSNTFEDAAKKLGTFNLAFASFAGNIASQAVTKGMELMSRAAHELFNTLVIDGVKSAQAEEDAVNKLNSALNIAGKYTAATSAELRNYADALQDVTKYGNDTIVNAMGLIESLGQLDKDGLKKATRATLDLSAALGIDLDSAARLVGKAAAGEVASFNRYGVAIEEGATKAETFSRALEAINAKFGGAAAAQVKTFSGQVEQLKNAWDDATKQIGQTIIQNEAVINVMGGVRDIINQLESAFRNNQKTIKEFIAQGLIGLIEGMQAAVVAMETVYVSVLKIEKGMLTARGVISAFTDKATFGLTDAGKRAQDTADQVYGLEKQIALLEKNGSPSVNIVQDALFKMHQAAEAGFMAIQNSSGAAFSSMKDSATDASNVSQAEIQKEIDKLIERNEAMAGLDDVRYSEEIRKANQAIEDKLSLLNQEATETIKIKKKLKDNENQIEAQRLGAAKDALNDLAVFQTSKTKELAAIGKAAAISSTVISTYEGAQKSYTSLAGIPIVGPVLGGLAAAAAIAGGIARVAAISGTPLATGIDSVPGIGNTDNFPAILQPKERVITRAQNEDLTSFLKGVKELGAPGVPGGAFSIEIQFKGDASEMLEARLIERERLGTRLGRVA